MVLWLRTRRGVHRIEDNRFRATFYAYAPTAELRDLRRRIGILDSVRDVRETLGRIDLDTDARVPVLEVHPRRYRDIREVARILDSAGGYYDVRLYNVDLRFSQRYCAAHGIFPFGLLHYANGAWRAEEDPFALDYPLPPFAAAKLDLDVEAPLGIPRMTDRLVGARVGDVVLDGSQEDVVRGIRDAVASLDPDVLVTDGGDAFSMPYLARKAMEFGVPLNLGRDPDPVRQRDGRSYFTYGKIVYKPGQHLLRGRIHLDSGHFAYREGDLAGLAELSRLSTLTPQEQSRLTPGTAISAMETNLALRDGALVLWKKNVPESFKTSEGLILGDRGGFIFEPEVGVHDGLYELDFASLYPNIMDRYNISLETWNCPCCEETGIRVPGLPYHFCVERRGVVPRTIKPLIDRRRYYKRMKKEPGPNREIYEGRDVILKWTLVTCLDGSTVVPYKLNGRYGVARIEQIINRYLRGEGEREPPGVLHVFGPDRGYRLVEKEVRKIIKARAPPRLLSISTRGGRRVLATPNHRFFALADGGRLVEKRADELREGDFLPEYSSLSLGTRSGESLNVLMPLYRALSTRERRCWRFQGDGVAQAVAENYPLILHKALDQGYTYRSVWLWKKGGPVPLQFLPHLGLTKHQLKSLFVGRGRERGGKIHFIPAEIRLDPNLAFFLGFYIGDGSGTGGMVRLCIGRDEPEIIGKLMNCVHEKFGLIGQVRKERRARMFLVQVNSISLTRILQTVFKVGVSSKRGKLVIPPWILNGSEDVRYAFLSGLLASDGSVNPRRDWASIYSYRRGFVESVSLLLMSLGVRYNFRSMRIHDFPLYAVDFLSRNAGGKLWLKDTHRKRLERPKSTDLNRRPDIPVVASGFLDLCRQFKATHSLPRGEKQCISFAELKRKTAEIKRKNGGRLPATAEKLLRLASANVSFRRVEKISSITPQSKYVYCFETEDKPYAFVVAGGLLVGNSFGYQGYKNARFGRIECHEAINAVARDILLRTMEIAESHGYEVVHGIVDSVWLRARSDAADIHTVVDRIAKTTGMSIDLEGRYRWIVFLPCKTTGVGALNRYYGLFEDGTFKLRGIELRRHDTPDVVNVMQEAMLAELGQAGDRTEFLDRVPRAVTVLRWTAKQIREGRVPLHAFVLTKSVTKKPEEYTVLTATAAALAQLEAKGFEVEPGESVRYVVLDMASRNAAYKVRPAEFLRGDEKPDVEAYVRLACRAAETLLAPFGYTEDRLVAMCRNLSDLDRVDPPPSAIRVQEDYKSYGHSKARSGVGYEPTWFRAGGAG